MSLNTAPLSFRRAAWALGLAGLLPFIALSWLSWRASPWAHTMLLQYGAIILSFVGALHWGLALGKQKPSVLALVWSVAPALLALAAVQLPPDLAAMSLALSLLVVWALDFILYAAEPFKQWFMPLRSVLSLTAAACLIIGAFAPR
jgi:Protein of unknown function (DUF3429)